MMNSTIILIIIVIYVSVLFLISRLVSSKQKDNDAFFRANHQSKWWLVAFGMIGASISGVSLVSVPGLVGTIHFSYLQMVLGFFFGYVIIAQVLLPIYYKLNLTSIYTYLQGRFGNKTYKTGASFFILSKMIGAAVRLYIVVLILQKMIFDNWNIPLWINTSIIVLLIWFYTRESGIKTVVWTDILQTFFLIMALVLIVIKTTQQINLPFNELFFTLKNSKLTDVFVFDNWASKQNFWKQFLSGVFIPIVMTGLDQDQMQKNLTCKTLREAQKNMYCYGMAFLPVNFILLVLGALLLLLAEQNGITIPTNTDQILPFFASQYLGGTVFVLFILGVMAAAFTSADSALTSLTTSVSIDILKIDKLENQQKAEKIRKRVHIIISVIFMIIILLIDKRSQTNIIDIIYTIVGYTYGPLLGLYTFGLFTQIEINDKLTPYIAIVAPLVCYALSYVGQIFWNYEFGYELLMIDGLLTFIGLLLIKKKETL